MAPTRLSVALALIALGPTAAADPVTRTDLVGDPLPAGAVARVGTVRFLPRPYLEQVFFSADGKTSSVAGATTSWTSGDAETGKPAGRLRDPDLVNFRMDQSPDGKLAGPVRQRPPASRPRMRPCASTTWPPASRSGPG